jgi:hypothetical protein
MNKRKCNCWLNIDSCYCEEDVYMTEERYKDLSLGKANKLNKEEIKQGWIFCCELDYDIVNTNWEHIRSICSCRNSNE